MSKGQYTDAITANAQPLSALGERHRQLPTSELGNREVLTLKNVHKSWGANHALKGVDLRLRAGEVHALLGENGAGKSTLMKIMFGIYQPSCGTITLGDGGDTVIHDPRHALSLGIGLVSQELSLVPQLDVAQNIFLGRTKGIAVVPRSKGRSEAHAILEHLAPHINVDSKVSSLGMADSQLVEIARTLARGGQVIAFDEPTSSLTPAEKNRLFETIRGLRDQGTAIVYISHRMSEIREIADRVTVLRDGRVVAEGQCQEFTVEALNEHIAGRKLRAARTVHASAAVAGPIGPVRVSMDMVSTDKLREVSLDLHAGEIVGLAGLVGSGRTSIMRALFGLSPLTGGAMRCEGRSFAPRDPAEAIAAGIALIPEDRRGQSIIPMASLERNFGLANHVRHTTAGIVRATVRAQALAARMEELDIRPRNPTLAIDALSGGNQQKVVIARWLETGAKVMLFDEPTRGIDVGAKSEIHSLLHDLAQDGAAILVASSELQEVLAIADRIAIVRDGRITDIITNHSGLDEDRLLELASQEIEDDQ